MFSVADLRAFVGLDYHDSVVQVCVLDREGGVLGNGRVDNQLGAILEFVDRALDGRLVAGAALESCCGAANLAEQLRQGGWEVDLAHAGICSRMKQNPDKTDFGDARLLADLVRVGYLPRVWLPPAEIRDLRRLTRHRQQLVEERRRIKLRIRAMLREERVAAPSDVGNVWTISWKQWLQSTAALQGHSRWVMNAHLSNLDHVAKQIEAVQRRMEESTRDDPVVKKLLAEKGIGLVTAVTMRAEIGSFRRFQSGKQLARYCAVTPRNVSSGKKQADGGLIQAGNLHLRTMLIEAAHRLARFVPKWKTLKDRLRSAGKPASVAAAAVANRWVRHLYWQIQEVQAEIEPQRETAA
jgi:transposase